MADPILDALEEPATSHDLADIAPLLWVLWHHLGGRSPVGQPIRRYLGIGQFKRLTPEQLAMAKQYQEFQEGAVGRDVRIGAPRREDLGSLMCRLMAWRRRDDD